MQGASEKKTNADDGNQQTSDGDQPKKGETSAHGSGKSQQKENVSEMYLWICTITVLYSFSQVAKGKACSASDRDQPKKGETSARVSNKGLQKSNVSTYLTSTWLLDFTLAV